jgi:proteic killer suppression protein
MGVSWRNVLRKVTKSKHLERQIRKGQIPLHILIKLQDWVEDVEERGLQMVRRIPGYHDEPCLGKMKGFRTIRLGKGWRAYYSIQGEIIEFVLIEGIDHHEYGK